MKKVFNFSLLAAAIVFILSACSSGTPSDAAKEYGNYLMSGKYENIIDMIDKQGASKEEIEEGKKLLMGMMQMVDGLVKQKDGYKDFKVISESIDGDKAEVVTKIIYGNGEEDDNTLNFILKDGKWMLSF